MIWSLHGGDRPTQGTFRNFFQFLFASDDDVYYVELVLFGRIFAQK